LQDFARFFQDSKMNNTHWFKHDCNAQHDPKVIDLLIAHGWSGYGLFWALVERLSLESNYKLKRKYNRIAFALQVDSDTLKNIVEDFELFILEDDYFYSESLMKRMEKLDEIKQKRAIAGAKGGKAKANAKHLPSKPLANLSRGDKIRVDKNKNLYGAKFEQFWHEYPSKIGKKKAFTSFKTVKVDVEVLIAAVKQQINSRQWKAGYIPHPATWLNQGRWEDDIEALNIRGNGKPLSDVEYDQQKREQKRLEENAKIKKQYAHIWKN